MRATPSGGHYEELQSDGLLKAGLVMAQKPELRVEVGCGLTASFGLRGTNSLFFSTYCQDGGS